MRCKRQKSGKQRGNPKVPHLLVDNPEISRQILIPPFEWKGKDWGPPSRLDSNHSYCYNGFPPACAAGAHDAALVQAWMNQDRKKNFFENHLGNESGFS